MSAINTSLPQFNGQFNFYFQLISSFIHSYFFIFKCEIFSTLFRNKKNNFEKQNKTYFLNRAIPDQLKCDSCLAVAYQIHLAFTAAHKPWAENQHFRLSEPEVLDIGGEQFFSVFQSCFGLAQWGDQEVEFHEIEIQFS